MSLKSAFTPAPVFPQLAHLQCQMLTRPCFRLQELTVTASGNGALPLGPWATQGCRLLRQTGSSLSPMGPAPWNRRAAGASGDCGAERGPRNAGPGFKCCLCLCLCLVVSLGLSCPVSAFSPGKEAGKLPASLECLKSSKEASPCEDRHVRKSTQEMSWGPCDKSVCGLGGTQTEKGHCG